jgi:hypothetical protein
LLLEVVAALHLCIEVKLGLNTRAIDRVSGPSIYLGIA